MSKREREKNYHRDVFKGRYLKMLILSHLELRSRQAVRRENGQESTYTINGSDCHSWKKKDEEDEEQAESA